MTGIFHGQKLPVRVKSHFVLRWLFFYFVLLPGLRPSAVSVDCSTSTEGLVLQDAFAWDILTNRLTPLGYVPKSTWMGRNMPAAGLTGHAPARDRLPSGTKFARRGACAH